MAKLTAKKRKAIPTSEFGLPKERKYPIQDKSHAENAKARAQQQYDQGKLSKSELLQIERKANKKIRQAGGKAAPASTKHANKSGQKK